MPKLFNSDGSVQEVEHINAYLMPGPDIFVKPRSTPICSVPKIIKGSQPTDDGNLILSEDEKNYFVKKYPQDKKFVRQLLGAEEFIHNKKRYCLWLVDATPDEIKNNKFIYERVKAVKDFRLKSKKEKTRRDAETPHLFQEIRQPTSNYILVPSVSGHLRKYIPMDFLDKNIIATNQILTIPDAEIWQFGILTSSIHMIFIDYAELILAAEKILKVRKNYPDASLADLYDEVTMPKDLRDAHKNLDRIVLQIYRYDESWSEEEIAINLLQHYKFVTDYLAANKMKQLGDGNFDDDE